MAQLLGEEVTGEVVEFQIELFFLADEFDGALRYVQWLSYVPGDVERKAQSYGPSKERERFLETLGKTDHEEALQIALRLLERIPIKGTVMPVAELPGLAAYPLVHPEGLDELFKADPASDDPVVEFVLGPPEHVFVGGNDARDRFPYDGDVSARARDISVDPISNVAVKQG